MAQHPEYPQDEATPREPSDLDRKLRAEEPPILADDTSPSRPVDASAALAHRLRAEEPPVSADDTAPTHVVGAPPTHVGAPPAHVGASTVSERLAAEEPPLYADDTNPNRALADRLWAEEPPIRAGDTSPSRAAIPPRGGRMAQRALGALMLLGAALLVALAVIIFRESGEDEQAGQDVATLPATAVEGAAVSAAATAALPTLTPSATGEGAAPVVATAVALRPTAAADEIAAALSAPVGQTVPVAFSASSAITRGSAPFTIRPGSQRTRVISYVVQEGDTLESIAAKFELKDYYTLVWSNPTNKYNPLRPGVDLNIPPVDGVYYEAKDTISIAAVAQELGVDPYSIIDAEYNNLFGSSPETLLVKGMRVMVPGGQAQRDLFFLAAPSATGTVSGGVVTGTYTLWGCTAEVSGGSMPFGRPLQRYTYMQGFRVGGHTGVDIAPGSGRAGDPIYASGSGTVVYAGWSDGGYGYVVVIAHGSVFSLYAHMNGQPSVSCGQKVSQGSVIGQVGSTGNSSGPHLHLEIRDANFNLLNPAGYVSF